ncbi:PucR family transcriptional regulator [Paeniglutamicibacter cryotolerans]|uniref:Purine catabolism regulator n=1 Tax=Paeniglutamicibacter cryotolerans TaxID=670079 RepID=A0A839QPS9_9MICC|nr:PucR family transcriptional regulator [Paeniglutamicibacter cryotolerans]MBB2994091.1 purine catabolism regulator [Paeniglutamicibacter cryotolerans]
MAITLSGLLGSAPLNLRALTETSAADGSPIPWAAVTELRDPSPFLSGGEIVLTTGLRQTTAAAQRSFVEIIHEAGVLALGFGIGLQHGNVPAAVVRRAEELGLPVFEVPYETPFVAITKMIADAISADHLGRLQRLLSGHQQLASALLGGGLELMLRELSRLLAAPVALSQYGVRVYGPEPGDVPWHEVPIATGLKDRCTLAIALEHPRDGLLDYAQGMIGLELANQARLRESTRRVAGQVLQDLVHGALAGPEAALRLQGVGITPSEPHAVLLIEAAPGSERALRTLPLPPHFEAPISGITEDRLAIVLATTDAEAAARQLDEYVHGAGVNARVGFGGGYAQANGLRWSFFEALEALRHGQRINTPSKLSLTSLLLAARDVPLAALAAEALEPLETFDKAHSAELLLTLRCYLEQDGSVGAVAEKLGLHRNTVRYRLQQVSELSGYDPTTTADRVQLWLAITARDVT